MLCDQLTSFYATHEQILKYTEMQSVPFYDSLFCFVDRKLILSER